VDAPTREAAEKIAKAGFAFYGTSVDPDATLHAASELWNSESLTREGNFVAPYTNIGGLFERAQEQIRTSCLRVAENEIFAEIWSVPMNLSTTNIPPRQFWPAR